MADIVWNDVLAIASELSTVPAGAQTVILGYANEHYKSDYFGGETSFEFKLLRMLLAAHLASATTTEGSAGASTGGLVTAESLGGIARQYTYAGLDLSSSDAALQTTAYGRQVRSMVRSSPARVGFAI
jgi:hypothetical protein